VLDADFNLKIVDFGLAALTQAGMEGAPLHYSGVGSLPYSAPEVYYVKDLYQGAGYEGEAADVWSIGVILFVMLTGRPPFARPLAKTYGPSTRRCKYFSRLMKGQGYNGVSAEAQSLLAGIFRMRPEERLSLTDIQRHPWFRAQVCPPERLRKEIGTVAREVWRCQHKEQMLEVLNSQTEAGGDRTRASSPHTNNSEPDPRASLLLTPVVSSCRVDDADAGLPMFSMDDGVRREQDTEMDCSEASPEVRGVPIPKPLRTTSSEFSLGTPSEIAWTDTNTPSGSPSASFVPSSSLSSYWRSSTASPIAIRTASARCIGTPALSSATCLHFSHMTPTTGPMFADANVEVSMLSLHDTAAPLYRHNADLDVSCPCCMSVKSKKNAWLSVLDRNRTASMSVGSVDSEHP
jgi:serine/threonine protein kinase